MRICNFILLLIFVFPLRIFADQSKTEAGTPATCPECLNSLSAPIDTVDVWKFFGECPDRVDPNQIKDAGFKNLQMQWADYQHNMYLRVTINSKIISSSPCATIGKNTADFIKNLSTLQNFIAIMDKMDSKGYFQIIKANRAFKELVHDKDFLVALRDLTDDQIISDKNDKNIQILFNKPDFLESLGSLRTELKNPAVMTAMNKVIDNDLTFLDSGYRKNAIQLSKILLEKSGPEIVAAIDSGKNPLIKDLSFPRNNSGPFFDQYKKLVIDDTATFVENFSPTIDQMKSVLPAKKFTDSEIAGIQSGSAPVSVNIVDEWILPLLRGHGSVQLDVSGKKVIATEAQLQAIDAVARTLWGEVASCGDPLSQMEAVGRVIADRSLSVKRAVTQKQIVDAQNILIKKSLENQLVNSQAGFFADTKIKAINWATNPYRGANEFGRPENPELDSAAQVVTRPDQFSVWRSYNEERTSLNKLNSIRSPNIPDTQILIQGPQRQNDTEALLRAVCPMRDQDATKWNKILKISAQIVLDPEGYVKTHQWVSPESNVFFYTHNGVDLEWAREVKIDAMKITDENGKTSLKPLRPSTDNVCQTFKLFAPKNGGKY